MSTHSTIAVLHEDGTVSQIYCNSDGYLSYNGKLLVTHYNSRLAAEFLVSKGNLSVLGKKVGEKIDFDASMKYDEDNFAEQCRYYGRDRGEKNTEPNKYADEGDYLDQNPYEDHNYFFNGESWEIASDLGLFVSVEQAIKTETEEQE